MERHAELVRGIAADVRNFFEHGEPYRIFHGSSNSTRPRPSSNCSVVDISALANVVSIDSGARTALVEPNVPMDRLVEATLAHGLIPPVVMEFPGITVGGGFAGTSGESSSFRHGFFNETVNSMEIILGNGDVIWASPDERADLFYGAAGAVGTLGVTTLLEVRLIEARKYVRTSYHRVNSIAEAVTRIRAETTDPRNDYLDGILFSPCHGAIITGQLTDKVPTESRIQTFSDAGDPWFYLHVQDKTQSTSPPSSHTEYIPLTEYLFRYDRAGFWVGRQGYEYFKYIPFNDFFRWFLDDFSHTRMLYHALHAGNISSRFIVQDLALPYDTAKDFIDYVAAELSIWPLWLCPLRETPLPTFHPVTRGASPGLEGSPEKKKNSGMPATLSAPMLNIGVWGWGPSAWNTFVLKNRALESKLRQLGGRKWLYAQTYYTEGEFWATYDRPWYEALREKYCASKLPTVFDKVRVDLDAKERDRRNWVNTLVRVWPIAGLYGMWVALLSGDYRHHRQAEWKHKRESKQTTTGGIQCNGV
ncbi:hypothetical protein CDD83_8502 [Cordyceps sp. RAO-2017]|nr:hypothetical protein CDD83_8502 [Cordyceps sp. RAO-2017]